MSQDQYSNKKNIQNQTFKCLKIILVSYTFLQRSLWLNLAHVDFYSLLSANVA